MLMPNRKCTHTQLREDDFSTKRGWLAYLVAEGRLPQSALDDWPQEEKEEDEEEEED